MVEGLIDRKQIDVAMAMIDKQFGKGSIMRLGDEDVQPWPSIPTGALALDVILGIGGLPRGRIVEIFGPESSGKSTLALSVVAEAQKLNEVCVYVDAENALDPGYMRQLGVKFNNDFLLSQPSSGEEALGIVEIMVKTGEVGVIVVDSVAALVPQAELDGEMGQSHVGQQSRLMSQAMRKLRKVVADTNTLLIFINQIREKIGIMFGNPETQPGGRALKFYASVRIDIRRREDIKNKTGEVIGIRSKVKTVKNKLAPALKQCEFDIIYGHGISYYGCIADMAVDQGLIVKSGAWFKYDGETIAQGRDGLISYLMDEQDLTSHLREQILNVY